jgi:hypothetical protein
VWSGEVVVSWEVRRGTVKRCVRDLWLRLD